MTVRDLNSPATQGGDDIARLVLDFDDNSLLTELFGEHDSNLALIENRLDITISSRGNRVSIAGPEAAAETARKVLRSLYHRLEKGRGVDTGEVEGAIRLAETTPADTTPEQTSEGRVIRTRKRVITPRSAHQADYIDSIERNELVFATGPAGTGKTYLAVAVAVSHFLQGKVDRLILSRPAVEAGESIGFLPGDMREKIDPYLRPLYDALHDMLPGEQVVKYLANGDIEVAPLGFMRGRTLSNAFIILDEAQNTTPMQMKMFLTRLGENSRMVVAGDPSQVDLPLGSRSGLRDALDVLGPIKGIGTVRFTDVDVVRHHLVTKVVQAYNKRDSQNQVAKLKDTGSEKAAGSGDESEDPTP